MSVDGRTNRRNKLRFQISPAQCDQSRNLRATFLEQGAVFKNNSYCKFAYGSENSVMEITRDKKYIASAAWTVLNHKLRLDDRVNYNLFQSKTTDFSKSSVYLLWRDKSYE